MISKLDDIVSIINGYINAKDVDRVFTYIEFVKMFGYENDVNTFITDYKDYVTRWARVKKSSIEVSDADFVMSKMVDILKSITLDYASYEEQDFIAHLDLTNKNHLKAMSALFSRKIRQITEFYRKKRNEAVTVIRKNSMKGSTKSIEEVIYEKVFDFVFSNKNIVPSYKNIKRDLMISVENYVDTYSEYFDIPRQKEFTDKTRAEMLSANMNDVDYRMYLEIELVVSEILFSGNVYLEEIPLVAQVGADLSQSCVGDMLALKNNLMANTQINQVELNEQIALKRRLYEKFLGCDLWYMYVDLQGNIKMDVLCKAKNPTGNLLNCGSADTATVENEDLTLLSHIGLFFKPQKTSILKVNAKDYTWTVDTDVIENDTMYVFPNPNKYGDIGNNKQASYPLLMEYKLDWDIRNLSSGEAANDPINLITDQGWASYYSKQDDDFKLIDNRDYEYVFTWLANRGFISNYQQDMWGNHFGILKGCDVTYKKDENDNIIGIEKVQLEEGFLETALKNENVIVDGNAILLNGGYFEDPFCQGVAKTVETVKWKDKLSAVPFTARAYYDKETCESKLERIETTNHDDNQLWCSSVRWDVPQSEVDKFVAIGKAKDYYEQYTQKETYWVYKNSTDETVPFNFDKRLKLVTNMLRGKVSQDEGFYNWSGMKITNENFFNDKDTNHINFGMFTKSKGYIYDDNFMNGSEKYGSMQNDEEIITDVILDFTTKDVYETGDINIVTKKSSYDEIQKSSGQFYIKTLSDLSVRPQTLEDVFSWVDWKSFGNPIDFFIVKNILIVETESDFLFIPYDYDGTQIINALGIREMYTINKNGHLNTKLLFVQGQGLIYILQIDSLTCHGSYTVNKTFIIPTIYVFDAANYKMKERINLLDCVYKKTFEENKVDRIQVFSKFIEEKKRLVQKQDNYKSLKNMLYGVTETYYQNFRDFEVPYYPNKIGFEEVGFSYNSSIGIFLLSFVAYDNNDTPYMYEYKFKINTLEDFNDSLISSVYTIKSVIDINGNIQDVWYLYNNKLSNSTTTAMLPQWGDRGSRNIFEIINIKHDWLNQVS